MSNNDFPRRRSAIERERSWTHADQRRHINDVERAKVRTWLRRTEVDPDFADDQPEPERPILEAKQPATGRNAARRRNQ